MADVLLWRLPAHDNGRYTCSPDPNTGRPVGLLPQFTSTFALTDPTSDSTPSSFLRDEALPMLRSLCGRAILLWRSSSAVTVDNLGCSRWLRAEPQRNDVDQFVAARCLQEHVFNAPHRFNAANDSSLILSCELVSKKNH